MNRSATKGRRKQKHPLADAVPHLGESRYERGILRLNSRSAANAACIGAARIAGARARAMTAKIFEGMLLTAFTREIPLRLRLEPACLAHGFGIAHHRVKPKHRNTGQRANHKIGKRAILHAGIIGNT